MARIEYQVQARDNDHNDKDFYRATDQCTFARFVDARRIAAGLVDECKRAGYDWSVRVIEVDVSTPDFDALRIVWGHGAAGPALAKLQDRLRKAHPAKKATRRKLAK